MRISVFIFSLSASLLATKFSLASDETNPDEQPPRIPRARSLTAHFDAVAGTETTRTNRQRIAAQQANLLADLAAADRGEAVPEEVTRARNAYRQQRSQQLQREIQQEPTASRAANQGEDNLQCMARENHRVLAAPLRGSNQQTARVVARREPRIQQMDIDEQDELTPRQAAIAAARLQALNPYEREINPLPRPVASENTLSTTAQASPQFRARADRITGEDIAAVLRARVMGVQNPCRHAAGYWKPKLFR